MKRMLSEKLKSIGWLNVISFLVAIIFAIMSAIVSFNDIDSKPASSQDYKELVEMANAIEESEIKSGNVIAQFENEECKVFAEYNNSKLISIEQKDKANLVAAITAALVIAVVMYVIVYNAIPVVILGVLLGWDKLIAQTKKLKKSFISGSH